MDHQITECRICYSSNLELGLDFGMIHPSGFLPKDTPWPDKQPLRLVTCKDCDLVQLGDTIPLDTMYRQYWYLSSLNPSMVADLRDVAHSAISKLGLPLMAGDVVVDIGCNDGTLFKFFPDYLTKVGFDPAYNLGDKAKANCNVFINNYFDASEYLYHFTEGSAKIVTAIAMFYDLPNPNDFLQDIKRILHPHGLFVIQFTDLHSMVSLTAFDNICHEHLEYYSLNVLDKLLRAHGLEIWDFEYNRVNGGSLRVYVQHSGANMVNPKVKKRLVAEQMWMKATLELSPGKDILGVFEKSISRIKDDLTSFLVKELAKGYTYHALGASTKGNTLLQVYEIDHTMIPYVAEVNQDKFGLRTVGTGLEIIPEWQSVATAPDGYLVLPWHFTKTWDKFLIKWISNQPTKPPMLVFPLPYGPHVKFLQIQKRSITLGEIEWHQ